MLKYLFSIAFLSFALISCQTTTSEKEIKTFVLPPADWSATKPIVKTIDKYYIDSVINKHKIGMDIKDPFSKKKYIGLELNRIMEEDFKPVSETKGYMPVKMIGIKDSAIVDFEITWLHANPTDTTGTFRVTDVMVQKARGIENYTWEKNGDFWKRAMIDNATIIDEKEKTSTPEQQKMLRKMLEKKKEAS